MSRLGNPDFHSLNFDFKEGSKTGFHPFLLKKEVFELIKIALNEPLAQLTV